jgi:hypothetical protein
MINSSLKSTLSSEQLSSLFGRSTHNLYNFARGSMSTLNLPALCAIFEEFLKHDYDFVIVGGGTAGLVVAARLTENPTTHVSILEAGPANIGDPMIMIPAMTIRQMRNPRYDWNHQTIPQVRHAWNSDLLNSHNYENRNRLTMK